MPHFPKPFFRPKKNRWYVQLDGKHVNLGPDKDQAFERYHQLMTDRNKTIPIVSCSQEPLLVEILDGFLDWCRIHREKRTFETYQERIQEFLRTLDDKTLLAPGWTHQSPSQLFVAP
jgi:hypothetical protein